MPYSNPKGFIEHKFAKAAIAFEKRWDLFSKEKTFIEFQLDREEKALEAEFRNICNLRKEVWHASPHASMYLIAPPLLLADRARSKDCISFDYNYSDTNYNASLIHLNGQRFIACEGPRECDVDNFFKTLVAYNVTHLVRLTCAIEDGLSKCHPYWEGLRQFNDDMIKLNIPNNGLPFSIQVFEMEDWKDNQGIDPKRLLTLVLQVRKATEKKESLLAIHCSAGVGRTGTFLAALAIVDAIESRKGFSIEELVYRLSLQRPYSVGQPSQYITLHRLAQELIWL